LGFAWTSTNQGRYILITTGIDGLISGRAGLWDANTAQYTASSNEIGWPLEVDANQDGTVISNCGSTPGIQASYPQFVDFDLNSLGFLEQHFDLGMPTGTPSLFFHPSGALLYKAGLSAVGGSVEIDDIHQWQPAATITFPEPFATSYSPATDRMLAIDNTGTYLFGVTNSGITMMVLNTAPLSIGNLHPSSAPPARVCDFFQPSTHTRICLCFRVASVNDRLRRFFIPARGAWNSSYRPRNLLHYGERY